MIAFASDPNAAAAPASPDPVEAGVLAEDVGWLFGTGLAATERARARVTRMVLENILSFEEMSFD